LKDAIVVTAGGAETLPFLASFCVLPASLAFFVLYGKLVRGFELISCLRLDTCQRMPYGASLAFEGSAVLLLCKDHDSAWWFDLLAVS
jgi:hypothetical protein